MTSYRFTLMITHVKVLTDYEVYRHGVQYASRYIILSFIICLQTIHIFSVTQQPNLELDHLNFRFLTHTNPVGLL